jgi:hypothetical protein
MAGIEGAIAADERGDAVVNRTGKRAWHVPVHTVMHDEKIHVGSYGLLKGNYACIHSGTNLSDSPVIRDLQAVTGAWIIGECRAPRASVAVIYKGLEGGHDSGLNGPDMDQERSMARSRTRTIFNAAPTGNCGH